jgi:multicomponent Na+:H+ antiporter subunit B
LRGHYLPGGGFVGGLIASVAFVLHAFANGLRTTQKLLIYHPGILIPVGLSVSLLSGFVSMFLGKPFMKGVWMAKPVPVIGSVGTPLIFDVGVYFVVIGVTLTILFTISEATLYE